MTNGRKLLNMFKPKTDQEWIDAFLQGKLSKEEIITFQQRLTNEAALSLLFKEQKILTDGLRLAQLSKKVQYFQGLNVLAEGEEVALDEASIEEAVRVNRNLEVLERFRGKGERIDAKNVIKVQRKSIMVKLAMAASIALFVLAGLFLWNKQQYSNHSLVALYQIESTSADRKETSNETISEKDKQFLYYQYLYASELLANREYKKAKEAYSNILQNQTTLNYNIKEINFEAVTWNLILIDLALGKEKEVAEQLKQLLASSISNKYKKDARSLQEKINSFWYDLVN